MSVTSNSSFVPPSGCILSSPFYCIKYKLNTSGNLSILITQTSGSAIKINGIACSSQMNYTGINPAYGNIYVLNSSSAGSAYYPKNVLLPSTLLDGGYKNYSLYCYSNFGRASGSLGSIFNGYLWINYSYGGIPGNIIQNVGSISAKYT
ncbi:MAG: hypothetical protein ACP5LP_03350 [Candidatus Micrarchaeia archaeon]